jgi:hypothetical protein
MKTEETLKEKIALSESSGNEQAFKFRLEILKQEIDNLQNNIRNYNGNLLIVKGWSITLNSAIMVYVVKENKPLILVASIMSTIIFWIFDAYIRRIQQFFISRYNKIEWFLKNPKHIEEAWEKKAFPKLNFPDITGKNSVRDLDFKTFYLRVALRLNVSLIYLLQLCFIVFLWVFLVFAI